MKGRITDLKTIKSIHIKTLAFMLVFILGSSGILGLPHTSYAANLETNNEKTFVFSSLAPDLVVQDITWSPINPSIGDTVTFTVTIKNQGSEMADASRVAYYIDDAYMSSDSVNPIGAGASIMKTFTWTAQVGSHEIKVVADFNNQVTENNENNNDKTFAFSTLAPDLVIQDITWSPADPSKGDTVTFSITIKNQGSEMARSSYIDFYIDGFSRGEYDVPRIDAGATATITLTWIAQSGTHEIKTIADIKNLVSESDESNNEKTLTFLTNAPDLVVQDITWSPANPSKGDTVTFTVTIKNQGSGRADYSYINYYIDDLYVSSDSVNPIDEGATNDQTFTWTAQVGSHEIKTIADYYMWVPENNESNNEKTFAFSTHAPDLVVQKISWSPKEPSVGEPVIFTVTIKNRGSGRADASRLAYYIGKSSTHYQDVPEIEANTTETQNLTWTVEAGPSTIKVVADFNEMVVESDESNNKKVVDFSSLAPDLVIEDITWSPADALVGDIVTFAVLIKNQGGGIADYSRINYYIDDVYVTSDSVNPIDINATDNKTFTWTAEVGSHEIKAVADFSDEVIEDNENNNEKTFAFSPLAPDLIIQDITSSPTSPQKGDTVTSTVTIKNQGNTRAHASCIDYYIDASPRGYHDVQEIDAGAIVTKTLTWTAETGSHEIKVVADSKEMLIENDESNNERIALLPPPDLIIQDVTWSPVSPSVGDTVTSTVIIKNQGNGRAHASRVAYYVDTSLIDYLDVQEIAAATTVTKTFTWIAEVGSHEIKVVADFKNGVNENNETNNEKTFAFSTLAPDLVIQDVTWSPVSPSVGDLITFTVTIKNQGNSKADASRVAYYADIYSRGHHDIQEIDVDATMTKTFTWTAEVGSHEIKVVADSNEMITESDETNNTQHQSLTISTAEGTTGDNLEEPTPVNPPGQPIQLGFWAMLSIALAGGIFLIIAGIKRTGSS